MARFRLVKISKRKVEVQKVRFKLNFVVLLISLACAIFVWLYVTGSNTPPEPADPEETHDTAAASVAGTQADVIFSTVSLPLGESGGSACEA